MKTRRSTIRPARSTVDDGLDRLTLNLSALDSVGLAFYCAGVHHDEPGRVDLGGAPRLGRAGRRPRDLPHGAAQSLRGRCRRRRGPDPQSKPDDPRRTARLLRSPPLQARFSEDGTVRVRSDHPGTAPSPVPPHARGTGTPGRRCRRQRSLIDRRRGGDAAHPKRPVPTSAIVRARPSERGACPRFAEGINTISVDSIDRSSPRGSGIVPDRPSRSGHHPNGSTGSRPSASVRRDSSRVTSPFSVMIWSSFKTVVYSRSAESGPARPTPDERPPTLPARARAGGPARHRSAGDEDWRGRANEASLRVEKRREPRQRPWPSEAEGVIAPGRSPDQY